MTRKTDLPVFPLGSQFEMSAIIAVAPFHEGEDVEQPWFDAQVRFALRDDGAVGITKIESDVPLTSAELRSVPWQRLIDRAVGDELYFQWANQDEVRPAIPSDEAEAAAGRMAKQMRKRRNRITDTLLADVAKVYKADGPDAVAEQFMVGRRQADRYIEQARAKDLLP